MSATRRTAVQWHRITAAGGVDVTQTFQYDGLNRLTQNSSPAERHCRDTL